MRASLTEAAIMSGGSRTLGIERRMLSNAGRISRGCCLRASGCGLDKSNK